MSDIFASAATLRRGVTVKALYFLLASADFVFTLLALRLGLTELNPMVSRVVESPGDFFLFKVMASLFLAWLIPSRLLIPGVGLLIFVVLWDMKELLVFLN